MNVTPFVWRRRVGMRDVDAWGVVWYGNYLAFCDEARAEVLRLYNIDPASFTTRGYVAPVVEVRTRYLKPARFDEEIDVVVAAMDLRGTRLDFTFEIEASHTHDLLVQVQTSQVLVRTSGELLYVLPPDLKEPILDMVQKYANIPRTPRKLRKRAWS